jgi:hypothetical protein
MSDDYEQDVVETSEKEAEQQSILSMQLVDTERTFEGNPSDRMDATLKEKLESEKSLKLGSEQTNT